MIILNFHSVRRAGLGLCALLALLGFTGSARAQILWGLPSKVTSDADVSTLGTYVDALQIGPAASRPSAQTVNGVLFKKPVASTDGIITLGVISQGFTASYTPAGGSTAYDAILQGTGGINGQTGGVNNSSVVTLSGLSLGHVYQVEVWSIGYATTFTSPGGASVSLPSSSSTSYFDIGTFTASSNSQIFSFMSTVNNNYGTLADISLRDITVTPEPSTYAMIILAGLGLLGFRKLRAA